MEEQNEKATALQQAVAEIKKTYEETFIPGAEAQAEKGNKAAGLRARKASLVLERLLHEFRKLSVAAAE